MAAREAFVCNDLKHCGPPSGRDGSLGAGSLFAPLQGGRLAEDPLAPQPRPLSPSEGPLYAQSWGTSLLRNSGGMAEARGGQTFSAESREQELSAPGASRSLSDDPAPPSRATAAVVTGCGRAPRTRLFTEAGGGQRGLGHRLTAASPGDQPAG